MNDPLQAWYDLAHSMKLRIRVRDIQRAVAEHYGLSLEELTGPSKKRYVARPRQIGMFLAIKLTPQSQPCIARLFGRIDHNCVGHAIRTIPKLMLHDGELWDDVDTLSAKLVHDAEQSREIMNVETA